MMLSRQRHALFADCLARHARPLARSAHFTLYPLAASDASTGLAVVHHFAPAQIDNNLGYHVVSELLPLLRACNGLAADGYAGYSEQEIFERAVGDIVRSIHGDERRAWHLFYDNTLSGLQAAAEGATETALETADFIAHFGAIYGRAIELIDAFRPLPTVLDMATCFGFFPLLLARRRQSTAAGLGTIAGCDLNPALVAFATGYARQRGLAQVQFGVADVLAGEIERQLAPLPATFDVVTALHLLEHLEPEQTATAVANLWRLTGRRLIVAIPLEEEPDARFGHRQVFDRTRLCAIGRRLGGRYEYFEYHGGWLVVDRPDRAL